MDDICKAIMCSCMEKKKINKSFDLLPKLLNYRIGGPIEQIWGHVRRVKLEHFYCFCFEVDFWCRSDMIGAGGNEQHTEY